MIKEARSTNLLELMFDYISGVTVECKGPLIPLDVNNYLGRFNFFAKINQVRQHTFTKYT